MFFEVRVDTVLDDFAGWLSRYKELTRKSWPQIMRKQCRLLSIELARRTQPFGWGSDAQGAGESAVARDVRKAATTAGDVFKNLKTVDKSRAGLFYQAYKAKQYRKAEKILSQSASRFSSLRFDNFTPQEHTMRRDKRGHVRGGNPLFITRNTDALDKYVKKVRSHVGWAKAAWVNCARRLGGIRGAASWVWKGKGGAPGVVSDRADAAKPSIILRNDVPYIENLLPEREQIEALRQSQAGIVLETKAALAANDKKARK